MAAVLTPTARKRRTGATGPPAASSVWYTVALVVLCIAAAVMYSWRVSEADLGNTYYAAAVRSMLQSPTNFLFGAADPAGIVSVDKPPLALWVQAASASLLGFHSWGLFLPQVVAGVLTVVALHRAVRIWAGERAALIAAAVMTLSPVTVALNRHNNTDTLLILFLVLAAWALTRGLQEDTDARRRRWLVTAAVLVGLGFNTKMLEAWIVLPAFAGAVWWGAAGLSVRTRVGDLVRSFVTLVLVSFSWSALRDLWPGEKPYMGGTVSDSAFELVFGYNGFGALLGSGQSAGGSGLNVPLAVVGLFGGAPGLDRLFSPETGGQIAWLLPLCAIVLVVVGAGAYRRAWRAEPMAAGPRAGGWVLWGGWLVTAFTVLSFTQGIFNSYYVSLLVPAVGAVAGAGLVRLWDAHRDGERTATALLAVGVAATALTAVVLVGRSPEWHGWIRWMVVALSLAALAVLAAPRLRRAGYGLALVAVAVLAGSASWSVASAASAPSSGGFPKAGPPNERFEAMRAGVLVPVDLADLPMPPVSLDRDALPTEMPAELAALTDPEFTGPVRAGGLAGHTMSAENAAVLDFARTHADGAPLTLLTEGGGLAASEFVLDSDEAVAGFGGFLGADPVPTTATLDAWKASGRLRFVLSAAPGPDRVGGIAGMGGEEARERVAWVQSNCSPVPPAAYGGSNFTAADDLPIPSYGDSVLYDCG
ncbi:MULTISPECIES: glycosyltransferase family 39 protein [unclassified Isoptericola]|uniref:ArnT family glycosyltransferase n=1 Tax=unclassified Isoptericola TaxID=2623355 RepID=UPI00271392BA|nr:MULTISPECIES: glycosyltransferase family 39 protein [unclassified Isoptericola]MDO8143834.1 glycosyltransferase family 39 protein [Isoptericola sp. 178]MDO8147729.1 glycosyltransferase family 39 protein [Isoptericola sp. b515]